MTTAGRLRKAVEAALPDGAHVILPEHGAIADADTRLREIVLAAVQPIVEEREAEIARLRAVLEWAAMILTEDRRGPGIAWRYMPDDLRAAVRGDWPAVRAAGVALPDEPPGNRRA